MTGGFFALLDDIALLADDVAVSAKIASQKTAAILGDDLAVNAEKATGFSQDRELKVIYEIFKGGMLNKFIIVPIVVVLNIFAPSLVIFALIVGGVYLLYEGAEKIEEYLINLKQKKKDIKVLLNSTKENILDIEKDKIKSAIRTDFILSIEIVVIALTSVAEKSLYVQIATVSVVAILATVFVYGIVALIVRMDNVGFYLLNKKHEKSGMFLINSMPKVIKSLAVIGTIAMILVGGGILSHNIHLLHEISEKMMFPSILFDTIIGLLVGFATLYSIHSGKHLFIKK
jgi:predicted DNA repair protein MutK